MVWSRWGQGGGGVQGSGGLKMVGVQEWWGCRSSGV